MTPTRPMFSQPFGPSPSYGPPPYPYEGATSISTLVRLDSERVAAHLPPGVSQGPDGLGLIAVSDYLSTSFGPYREFSVFVHAIFEGREYMYSPIMLADSAEAVAAGRELWGFAKKTADMTFHDEYPRQEFTATGNEGTKVANLRFESTEQTSPAEISRVDLPTLTLRLIPSLNAGSTPDIAQLVATVNPKTPLTDADGTVLRWTGVAQINVESTPELPLADFRPIETITAWMTRYTCLLPAGELVHDYLGCGPLSHS